DLCFFSSRRRHTRSKRDWSSDVCSSDLTVVVPGRNAPIRFTEALGRVSYQPRSFSITLSMLGSREKFNQRKDILANLYAGQLCQIGRASCRERVGVAVAAAPDNR